MLALELIKGRRQGLVAAALILVVGSGVTVIVRRDPSPSDCASDTPLFAYTADASKLRQTDVAAFREGKIVRVTTDQLSQNPSFSPDGSKVVFSSGRDGEFNAELGYNRLALFTASSTGGDEQRLTSGVYDDEPDWSPDGAQIVFVRSRYSKGHRPPQNFPDREELWTVDVDTGEEDILLRAPAKSGDPFAFHSPVWSPDGSQIAFSRASARKHGLWLMDADGSDARRLVADIGVSYFDSPALAWSPNGKELAFNGGTEHGSGVVVLDLDDRRQELFAPGGESPAWSPDGSRIAYFEFQPPDEGYQLTLRSTERGEKEHLEGPPVYGGDLDWACVRASDAGSAVPTPGKEGARCDQTFRVVHRSVDPADLVSVDLTPTGEGWAVGEGRVSVVRFDENSYEVVSDLPLKGGGVYLDDVSARSTKDVFVAGSQKKKRWKAVVLRWDGDRWARMETPQPPNPFLHGIVAVAPNDVWAVGASYVKSRARKLLLNFDGTKWSQVDPPSSGLQEGLTAVAASSSKNVWAIGSRGSEGDRAVVLRYDGSRWVEVDLPDRISGGALSLSAIEVVSRHDVWIVGIKGRSRRSEDSAVALHFDGLRWESERIRGAGRNGYPADVEVVGPRDIWAVGYTGSIGLEGTAKPLALRRTDAWRPGAIEDPAVGGEFTSVAADDAGNLWAVGEKAGSGWVIQRACRRAAQT